MRFLENNVTFASGRVTLIAIHSKAQKLKRLPIRYLDFSFPFKLPKTKEVIKAFQNYRKYLDRLFLQKSKQTSDFSACFKNT